MGLKLKMRSYLESCKTEFWKKVFERELKYLLRELEGCRDILSVGCGPAIIEKGLQENGFNVTGLDISEEAFGGAPDSVRKMVCKAEKIESDDESYDAAIFVASLQFIDGYAKAVADTSRVLKSGGKVVFMLINTCSDYFKSKQSNPDSYINRIKHTDIESLVSPISRHFTILKSEYYLGIEGKKVFDSNDPISSGLYIITGTKK